MPTSSTRSGVSSSDQITAAVASSLEKLQEAIEATERAISDKMKEMGMEPFTGPVITAWKEEVTKTLRKENTRITRQMKKLIETEVSSANPVKELQGQVRLLTNQLRAREEEINRLYNMTESDPKYQAYHVLRDLSPNWVDIAHVGRSLGIPAVRAKRLLDEFVAIGLVEIDGKRARALQLIRKADTTQIKTK